MSKFEFPTFGFVVNSVTVEAPNCKVTNFQYEDGKLTIKFVEEIPVITKSIMNPAHLEKLNAARKLAAKNGVKMGPRCKLSDDQIDKLRKEFLHTQHPAKYLAKKYKISTNTLYRMVKDD